MKAKDKPELVVYDAISDLHKAVGVAPPLHPLVSVIRFSDMKPNFPRGERQIRYGFYKVSFIEHADGKIGYGQRYYDFSEGGMAFIGPNQVITDGGVSCGLTGLSFYFHHDFLAKHPLGQQMKQYRFFSYELSEALHLSDKEKSIITDLFRQIENELQTSIDAFSQDLLISYIELLLNYSNRFYNRQFLTRKVANNDLLDKVDQLLTHYLDDGEAQRSGLPTVQFLAQQLHMSPDYLSDMLRVYTGQSTQQHIQQKLMEKARELLLNTDLSTAEIAYALGFEHPQSFNRIFKRKMEVSPMEFRQSFN
ncbi:AraC family transcriptional regulator [Chitinophaga sp. Cy-1792]|uniref:helix-turn-helix domain-containing protein n=1 Tax=Chitinophaga sp. Cy-1792 TaxID=2608339 RepID=UPI00141DBDED|nr:helix-turn-helix transcriptional regulator [Chitinophaga sp. Cy-1792]NIG54014.1 helix-turn-helix transcriptional regulator [Chitinophaga sp. Cy-1792]